MREYLLANPELLLEVQQALDAKQKEEQRVAQKAIIKDAKDKIFKSAHDGIVGNPDGKITIVEFFDYNCGYCKRAVEDMQALTAADPDLRFVLKEFPILGPDSQKASVVSMAFRKHDAGEIRRVPQPAARRPWPRRRGQRHQDRRLARRRRGQAARGNEGPGDQPRSSTRPTNSPTSWRSPARRPTWSATRWCSARRAATCSTRRSPSSRRPARPPRADRLPRSAGQGRMPEFRSSVNRAVKALK